MVYDVDIVQNVLRGVDEEAGDHQIESTTVVVAIRGTIHRIEASELHR